MTTAALDDLAGQAEALDAPAAAAADGTGPPAELAPAAPGNFESIAFLLAGFREVAGMILKVNSLRRTLADPQIEQCARVLAPVADKYGLQLGGMLGGPEAAAIMVAGPILWGAWRELDAELTARRAKKADDDDAAPVATGAGQAATDGG